MHKLNKKGYMLIELILASFLAITVGLYLIELIFNFREKVQDDFYSSNIYKDKVVVTKSISSYLNNYKYNNVSTNADNTIVFNSTDAVSYILKAESNSIHFGINDNSSFLYEKTFDDNVTLGNLSLECPNTVDYCYIKVPVTNLYDKNNYDLKFVVKMSS